MGAGVLLVEKNVDSVRGKRDDGKCWRQDGGWVRSTRHVGGAEREDDEQDEYAEADEAIDDAVARELTEETGRRVQSAKPALAVFWVFPEKPITNIVFTVELGEHVQEPADEVAAVESFTDLPDEISFHDSGRIAYEYIITELVHDGTATGYFTRVPVDRPSNRVLSAIAGLTVSGVVIAGAAQKLLHEDDEPDTPVGAGWRETLEHVRSR